MTSWRLVEVADTELEVSDEGAGEPIVFVQTALTADELVPLAATPALADHRRVLYHRRGYAGSGAAEIPGSIARDAADCRALLDALAIEQAHVVGVSYSGAIALQLATDAPEVVHTLTLIEPPPTRTPSAAVFRAANDRLLTTRRERGPAAALDEFLTLVVGHDWRVVVERGLPGATAQIERDTLTFFDADLPALSTWPFGADDAARIARPVLHIGGSDSGRFFAEVRDLILAWFPDAEDVVIEGADHSLVITHASDVAAALADFTRRHRITSMAPPS
jgi:pimeloyl-ACP methyl ester carboxylesterase